MNTFEKMPPFYQSVFYLLQEKYGFRFTYKQYCSDLSELSLPAMEKVKGEDMFYVAFFTEGEKIYMKHSYKHGAIGGGCDMKRSSYNLYEFCEELFFLANIGNPKFLPYWTARDFYEDFSLSVISYHHQHIKFVLDVDTLQIKVYSSEVPLE